MKWKRKLLPKTNNVESSKNPISIPSDLHNHDESLHISIPSDLDNHDESLHIPPLTEPCEITAQVVRSHVSGRSQLFNSSCDSPVEGGWGSASGYLKLKSPVSTSCDAFSRYSELCGRNVLAKHFLDVPPAVISSNFIAVEQLNLEVFEKYSDMCGNNTVTRFSTPSMNIVRTANVINSQTIFSEPLRLNVSEEVALSHDRAHLNVAAEEVSSVNKKSCSSGQPEDLSRVGGTILNVPKKRQRNIPSVESPSKRVRQTAPRVRNRRTTTVMRDDGEGCSSGQGRGSLCPLPGESLRFLQLYIYDTDHEVENRMRHFSVQLSRIARDKCKEIHVSEFKIRLYNAEGARGYELPTSNTLGAVVFDSEVTGSTDFDVIIQEKAGPPKRINKLHKSYMSLQFPLLFVYGQAGFHTELKLRAANGSRNERRLTILSYYVYQLHPHVKEYNLVFRAGRLFQQYVPLSEI
ncbi:hypothetical protein Tco_1289353, partial [Tanacetum coccineum]